MPRSAIFLHLQKTGGTSVRKVMRNVFGPKRVAEGMTRRSDGTWNPMQRRHLLAEAWMGHLSFGIHTQLPRPVPYFTVLREPVRREISRYCSMPQIRFKQKRGLAESVDPEWGAVYMLSGISLDNIETLGPEHVGLALRNMHEHFLYAGDTSRMVDLGVWLRSALRWEFELPMPHENPSGTEIKVTDEEIAELRRHPQVQLDQELYMRVCELGPYPSEWRL